ncbi:MAG: hypothetical protein AAFX76_02335 [Planctomycetota bacterium]
MPNQKTAAAFVLAATLTLGLVAGLSLNHGPSPAFAQPGTFVGAAGYVVEEIQSIDEKTKHHVHNGRTLAVVTPSGNLKVVRISWKRTRGDDDDFPVNYADAGGTYQIEILPVSAELGD